MNITSIKGISASTESICDLIHILRRYEEDMYWRRMEEEQHHWDDRHRIPDGGYPHGPPGPLGLLGVRPGMPPQPQGPAVSNVRIVSLLLMYLVPQTGGGGNPVSQSGLQIMPRLSS